MKFKTTDADGTEVEVEASTQAELDVKLAEQKTAMEATHKAELDAKEGNLSTLATEKKDLEARILKMELAGIKPDDHPNFAALKSALDRKDTEIKDIKTALDDDKKQRVTEDMDSKIKIASRGNTELENKIKYHLEKTVMGLPEKTVEERKTKLEAAYKLAADISGDGPGIFDMGTGGSGKGSGGGDGSGTGVEFSAKEIALGNKLGITDADRKKYSSRVSKRN